MYVRCIDDVIDVIDYQSISNSFQTEKTNYNKQITTNYNKLCYKKKCNIIYINILIQIVAICAP